MSTTIIIRKEHWDDNTNKFIVPFPSDQKYHNKLVALQSLSLYNSFFNVSVANANNTITINFLGTDYKCVIDDGYYSVDEINLVLQKFMLARGICVLSTTEGETYGKAGYFITLASNKTKYAAEFTFNIIYSASDHSGVVQPTNATWTYPETAITPTITFSDNFGKLIGMTGGTYPSDQSVFSQQLSTFSPEISVVNSLMLTCNLVSNPGQSIPHNAFFAFGLNAPYLDQMKLDPYPIYAEVKNGNYQNIEIVVHDQNNNVLKLYDTDGNITLSIIDKK